MFKYQSTTKRRYLWGIGFACSLLLVAIAGSWALEGRVGYRMRSFGPESVGEFRRDDAPVTFWLVVGGALAGGIVGSVVTAVGLARVQREEEPIQASETTRGKCP
jgi:hypothetical protein